MSHSHRIHDDHDHVEPEIYVNSRRVRVSYALLTGNIGSLGHSGLSVCVSAYG